MPTAINCLTHLHESITLHVELLKKSLQHLYHYSLQDKQIVKVLVIALYVDQFPCIAILHSCEYFNLK